MAPFDPKDEREIWERIRAAEVRLEEREKSLNARWQAQEVAIEKATSELEARLTLLNELRGTVLSRDEYDGKHDALMKEIGRNREDLERLRGIAMTHEEHAQYETRLGRIENWRSNVMGRAVAIALVGAIIVTAVAAIFTHLLVK